LYFCWFDVVKREKTLYNLFLVDFSGCCFNHFFMNVLFTLQQFVPMSTKMCVWCLYIDADCCYFATFHSILFLVFKFVLVYLISFFVIFYWFHKSVCQSVFVATNRLNKMKNVPTGFIQLSIYSRYFCKGKKMFLSLQQCIKWRFHQCRYFSRSFKRCSDVSHMIIVSFIRSYFSLYFNGSNTTYCNQSKLVFVFCGIFFLCFSYSRLFLHPSTTSKK
jgi:hypothetical protein